jgi:hypothetical protein
MTGFMKKNLLLSILIGYSLVGFAQETFPTGSVIVNMGLAQTVANGVKPYGMVFDLIKNNKVQVKWIISPTKLKDGIDFTYNAVSYSGGTFIIPQRYITAAVLTKITTWNGLGVVTTTTTSPLTLTVAYTLRYTPRWTFDFANGSIAQSYLTDAGIPLASFPLKTPAGLNGCDDIFVMPHADPTWATHSNLYYWNNTGNRATTGANGHGGWLWNACHAVSVLEGLQNPLNPAERMNFLSTNGLQCYGAGKCDVSTETDVAVLTPTSYAPFLANDPVGQFMGDLYPATTNGSQQWYQPQTTSAWRSSSKVLGLTSNAPFTTRQGTFLAYGNGLGDPNRGMVMYEGGHDQSGAAVANVAALRAFFNFSFLATTELEPKPSPSTPPAH